MTSDVYVVRPQGRKYWQLRWTEPGGQVKQQSARTTKRREAERMAARKAIELAEARHQVALHRQTWQYCRDRFVDEHVARTAARTQTSYLTALSRFEGICDPHMASECTSDLLAKFVAELLADELSPNTIKGYLRHLRPLWTMMVELGVINRAPTAKAPTRGGSAAKGRPLTAEEFERMLEACRKVVGPERDSLWRIDLKLLWLSGLRLSEAMTVTFDDPAGLQFRGLGREQPMLAIPTGADKSGRQSLTPLTPDLVDFLRSVHTEPRGLVFAFASTRGRYRRVDTTSKVVTAIGKAANVVSSRDHRGNPHYAGAHDLRRSFGNRWAPDVEPPILQRMMRHRSITTTMQYYVDLHAHQIGEKINQAFERMQGNAGTVDAGHRAG